MQHQKQRTAHPRNCCVSYFSSRCAPKQCLSHMKKLSNFAIRCQGVLQISLQLLPEMPRRCRAADTPCMTFTQLLYIYLTCSKVAYLQYSHNNRRKQRTRLIKKKILMHFAKSNNIRICSLQILTVWCRIFFLILVHLYIKCE